MPLHAAVLPLVGMIGLRVRVVIEQCKVQRIAIGSVDRESVEKEVAVPLLCN
jgi:hypothetical protein